MDAGGVVLNLVDRSLSSLLVGYTSTSPTLTAV